MVQPERLRKKKHLMSCDACRYRRIKCVRDTIDEECEECHYRGFFCTSEHIKARRPAPQRPAPREGRRLSSIKSTGNASTSTSNCFPFSPTENKIGFNNMDKQLMRHFFEIYLNHTHIHLPTGSWSFYHLSFIQNDCDLDLMRPDVALVCACAIAIGSRWAGSEPLFGGGKGPGEAGSQPSDLSSWNSQRDAFFMNISNRAFQLSDSKAVHKIVTSHSLRANLMTFYLRSYVAKSTTQLILHFTPIPSLLRVFNGRKNGRPATIESAHDDPSFFDVDRVMIWMFTFICDADISVQTGYPLCLSERDIELAQPRTEGMTTDHMRSVFQTFEAPAVAEVALPGLFLHVAQLIRYAATELCPEVIVNPDPVTTFLHRMDELIELINLFYERAKSLFATRFIVPFHWVFFLRQFLTKTTWVVYTSLAEQSDEELCNSHLDMVMIQVHQQLLMLIRTLCKMLHMTQGRMPPGGNDSLNSFAQYADFLMKAHTPEQAALAYPFDEKLSDLDILQSTLWINSWILPSAGDLVRYLQAERMRLDLTTKTIYQNNLLQFTTADYLNADLWSTSWLLHGNTSTNIQEHSPSYKTHTEIRFLDQQIPSAPDPTGHAPSAPSAAPLAPPAPPPVQSSQPPQEASTMGMDHQAQQTQQIIPEQTPQEQHGIQNERAQQSQQKQQPQPQHHQHQHQHQQQSHTTTQLVNQFPQPMAYFVEPTHSQQQPPPTTSAQVQVQAPPRPQQPHLQSHNTSVSVPQAPHHYFNMDYQSTVYLNSATDANYISNSAYTETSSPAELWKYINDEF